MRSPYFFFRPLVSASHGWVAFDLGTAPENQASCHDYVRCIKAANAAALGDSLPIILNVEPSWLDNIELTETLEPRQAIFVLPQAALGEEKALAASKKLRGLGYHISIDITDKKSVWKIPLASFDHVSLGASFAHNELLPTELSFLDDAGFRKIATGVSAHEMFSWVTAKGFSYCDSAFLVRRNPTSGRQPDLARLKLLKLLGIVEHDGDTREIEAIFREEPKLSYNLLRLVNSVAVGARTRISNFAQAIAILGRRQLQRWLQLLIYANNLTEGNAPNPLMQMAAARGRQIELLCKSIEAPAGSSELCDNAFMTGLFSLLDVLINLPMADILKELPLQDEVMDALRTPENGSVLGKLLTLVALTEAGQFSAAEKLLDDLDISPDTYAAAQVAALHWAARINIDRE